MVLTQVEAEVSTEAAMEDQTEVAFKTNHTQVINQINQFIRKRAKKVKAGKMLETKRRPRKEEIRTKKERDHNKMKIAITTSITTGQDLSVKRLLSPWIQ